MLTGLAERLLQPRALGAFGGGGVPPGVAIGERLTRLLQEVFGLDISEGALANAFRRLDLAFATACAASTPAGFIVFSPLSRLSFFAGSVDTAER